MDSEKEKAIHEHESHSHEYGVYILVFFGLLALTAITVSIAGLNLGSLTLTVALVIATIKTCLVANYFMHVKFDSPIFKVFIAVCIVIFATMIGLTFFDLIFR
ncbi:MAG: cytochrome C oxidase subunit IV family protein [Bacteroidetes bacterium]|nr:cytochrome C oxidase subunit IV family protein [Bacteroidota bacterium]MBX7046945.1 cytochrome C oxidase subunit IV family protein [Ignavibacteria bacterium]